LENVGKMSRLHGNADNAGLEHEEPKGTTGNAVLHFPVMHFSAPVAVV